VELGEHVREDVLDGLELVDAAAERRAVVDELVGLLDGGRREPESVSADDDCDRG